MQNSACEGVRVLLVVVLGVRLESCHFMMICRTSERSLMGFSGLHLARHLSMGLMVETVMATIISSRFFIKYSVYVCTERTCEGREAKCEDGGGSSCPVWWNNRSDPCHPEKPEGFSKVPMMWVKNEVCDQGRGALMLSNLFICTLLTNWKCPRD